LKTWRGNILRCPKNIPPWLLFETDLKGWNILNKDYYRTFVGLILTTEVK